MFRALPWLLPLALVACDEDPKPVDTAEGGDTDTAADTDTSTNAAPTAPEIVLSPAAPSDASDLVVTVVTPATDPDGDAVTYRYAWSVDGAARADLATETVPAAETADGQTWTVEVVPNDGALDGPAATASVTVGNAPPTAPTIHLEPQSPAPGDDLALVVDAAAADPNGDALTQTIRWYVDGSLNGSWDDATTVSGAYVEAGETYRVVVSVTDGLSDPVTAEATATVGNQAPEVRGLGIEPSDPRDNDDLAVSIRAVDPDGDALAYTYTWYRDGSVAADVGNVDTVTADLTTVGEVWEVAVEVSDGVEAVTDMSASVTIQDVDRIRWASTFSTVVAADRSVATGSWTSTLYTSGVSYGANDCDIEWSIDAAVDPRVCPRCTFSFRASYPLASSTVRSPGILCADWANDGVGTFGWDERAQELDAYAYTGGRYGYGYVQMYLYGLSGYYSYGYYGYTMTRSWWITTAEDTAGNTHLEAYQYVYMAY